MTEKETSPKKNNSEDSSVDGLQSDLASLQIDEQKKEAKKTETPVAPTLEDFVKDLKEKNLKML